MVNTIKTSKNLPADWNKVWIRALKKNKGSFSKLDNYRGIFLVPILSIIFEKLLKNKIYLIPPTKCLKVSEWRYEGQGLWITCSF